MKRIAISVLTLALSVAAGGAFAGVQDYGNDPRYDRDQGPPPPPPPPRALHTDRAEVVNVVPVGGYDRYQYRPNPNASTTYEREECWNQQTNGYEGGYYRDSDGRLYREGESHTNTGGMLIGALIGGALGNTVGKGDGRTAATIGGAVVGGAIGAHVDNDHDEEYRDNGGVVRRCRTVVTTVDNDRRPPAPNGYRVTYRYAGQTYEAFMGERPGRWIQVTVDVRPQGGYRR
jgi:outer membrane lipoprotein SlyB